MTPEKKQFLDDLFSNNEKSEKIIQGKVVNCTTVEWLKAMYDKELEEEILKRHL
jgi:hypothetical protein